VNIDIQERLTAFAMLGATWVMWLLVLLSIVCVAIVLERTWFMLSSRDDILRLRQDLVTLLRKGDLDGARRRLDGSKSFEARVVHAGLEVAGEGPAAAQERMTGESRVSRLAMERNLAFLGTVGNNAPFVGLLGTVIGIIRAFHELDQSAGQVTSGLMNEVGEALVATAIGILVALPAVAAFNLFQRIVRSRLGRADALGNELLAHLNSTRAATQVAPRAEEATAAAE
jgi:biopolymer transport protein ExbB